MPSDPSLGTNSAPQCFGRLTRAYCHPAILRVALLLGVFGAPLFLRVTTLFEKHLAPSRLDARGLLLDIAAGLCLLVLCNFIAPLSRIAATCLVGVYVLVGCVSWEHVRVLNSLSLLHNARYLFDPVFFRGSVLHPSRSTTIALLASLPCVFACWSPRTFRFARSTLVALGCVGVTAVVTLVAFRPDSSQLAWRRENVIVRNASDLLEALVGSKASPVRSQADVRQVFAPDLSGRPRHAASKGESPNILLVFIEGLSGAYVPSIARYHGVTSSITARRLDTLSPRALTFTNVFAQQRQTNRGEYAVLCGDYPKLRSDTPRMTEMALGQLNRVCLPQILRDAGYATSYLQAAPMPFMLKDKFMVRAGFDEQHGTEFFRTAYKRNSWGVDDRTFFEGALRQVRTLETKRKPWFLSLLTVGTHHPFLVPAGCEGPGSTHAQAVECADLAIYEFIETLEKEGVLENTLVLITSDESDGVQEGDDVGQALSQNWIPLLALLPRGEGAGQVNHSMVLQSDIALSVLDYLGRADRGRHFVGRSFFREYAQPRTAYFANTYLNRVWMLEPEFLRPGGRLSACTEALDDCVSYVVNYERPLDVRRTRMAGFAQPSAEWQAVIERSTETSVNGDRGTFGTRQLLVQHSLQLDATDGGQIVFGGQYLNLSASSQVDVDVEFSLEGVTGAQVSFNLVLKDGNKTYWSPAIPRVVSGDRLRIRGRYALAEPVSALEATMHARVVGGSTLEMRFSRATLAVTPRNGIVKSTLESESVDATRGAMPGTLVYRLGATNIFEHTPCLAPRLAPERLEGAKCRGSGYLVYGPHVWVSAGTRLRARFDVAVTRGVTKLHSELSANSGKATLSKGEKCIAKAGDRVVLESYFASDDELADVEARLGSEQISAIADYVVTDAVLELVH